jgi:hypothetical protein
MERRASTASPPEYEQLQWTHPEFGKKNECTTGRTGPAGVQDVGTQDSIAFLPAGFIAGVLSIDSSRSHESMKTYSGEFILIPKSNGSMSNLDQILALIGGVIVLLAALRHVYRSRRDKEQSSEKVKRRRRSIWCFVILIMRRPYTHFMDSSLDVKLCSVYGKVWV